MDSYSLFQFAVDNASSVERSVALLFAELPTRSEWLLQYFTTTRHPLILYGFFVEHMRSLETEADLELFRQFLHASEMVPDRWLLKAACDTHCPSILEVLLEIPGAETAVDDWICVYVCEVPELLNLLTEKKTQKMYSDV